MASLLPTPEPPDPIEGALGHFEHSNWVKAALKALDAGSARVDGSVSLDKLTVDHSSDETAQVVLRGSVRTLSGRSSNDFGRWQFVLGDGTAEGGNDSGSLFRLYAFGDTGGLKHTVLAADRASGLLTVTGSPTAAKGIATKEYSDAQIPIGAIIAFGSGTLPVEMQSKWHLCDGTDHGSAALQAVISNTKTPDLRGRFVVGSNPSYPVGATGGLERVLLTAAESGLPTHTHPTTTSSGVSADHHHSIDAPSTRSGNDTVNHSHWIDPPNTNTTSDAHNHTIALREGTGTGDGYYVDTNPTDSGVVKTLSGTVTSTDTHYHAVNIAGFSSDTVSAWHQHDVNIPSFNSSGVSADHTHVITGAAVLSAPAGTSHENRPPYYALTYIIKKA